MRKQVKKWGKNLVISFDKEDQDVYSIYEGSIIAFEPVIINKETQIKKEEQKDGSQ